MSSRNDLLSSRAHSVPENADARSRYHPFEEIEESAPTENGESPRLSDAEIARTIIEVYSYYCKFDQLASSEGSSRGVIEMHYPGYR